MIGAYGLPAVKLYTPEEITANRTLSTKPCLKGILLLGSRPYFV